MELVTVGLIALGAFLLGYILFRLMGSDGWDDSNITNALRLLSHVTLHPEDFGKMYYIPEQAQLVLLRSEFHFTNRDRPFWYVSEDEFDGVVKTRP